MTELPFWKRRSISFLVALLFFGIMLKKELNGQLLPAFLAPSF